MSSYVSPALREQFESLSVELKNEILSHNVHLEKLGDLISALETVVSEENEASEVFPSSSDVSSANECTGLMPSAPADGEEYESYRDLYGMEIPK